MGQEFTGQLEYWVGVSLKEPTQSELGDFHRHYSKVHVPEVVAANGFSFGSRYEMLQPDPRGDFGPTYIAMYEIPDEAVAQRYIERNDGQATAGGDRPRYTPGPPVWTEKWQGMWRLMWRRVSDSGPVADEPTSIMLIGINPPEDIDEAGLEEFNDFYTNVHAKEVIEQRGLTRVTRWEIYREFRHPEPGCPRYLAAYESASSAPTVMGGRSGQLSTGPEVWRRHTTPWRLQYTRISPDSV